MARENTARSNVTAWALMTARSNDICFARDDPRGKRLGRRFGDEDAGDAVDDRLESATTSECNYRRTARLRFDGRDAEVFLARKHDGGGAPIEIAHLFVGHRSEQLHVGAGRFDLRRQPGALRAVADDAERRARQAARLDREVYAFVWNEG